MPFGVFVQPQLCTTSSAALCEQAFANKTEQHTALNRKEKRRAAPARTLFANRSDHLAPALKRSESAGAVLQPRLPTQVLSTLAV